MKKWRMQFQAITQVEVDAENYTEAIQKGEEIAMEKSIDSSLIWSDFKVLHKTIEMVEK